MTRRTAAGFGFIALIGSGLNAQVPAPQSFGTDEEGISIIGFQDFFPEESSHGYLDSGVGERRSDAQDLIAGINMIPNGALLVQVVFYVRDSDGDVSDDIEGRLCRTFLDSGTGAGLLPVCLGNPASTSGAPGETTLVLAPDRQIVYRQDITADGNPDVVNYYLKVTTQRKHVHPDGSPAVAAPGQPCSPDGDIRRRADGPSLFPVHRSPGRVGDHGGMQRGAASLLSRCASDARADGRVPGQSARAPLVVESPNLTNQTGRDSFTAAATRSISASVSSANIGSARTSFAAFSACGKSPSRPPSAAKHFCRWSGTG